jgi:hypothetical protein
MPRRQEVGLGRPKTPMRLDSVKRVQFVQGPQKSRDVLGSSRMNDIEIKRQNWGCVNQSSDAANDDEISVVVSEFLENRTKPGKDH